MVRHFVVSPGPPSSHLSRDAKSASNSKVSVWRRSFLPMVNLIMQRVVIFQIQKYEMTCTVHNAMAEVQFVLSTLRNCFGISLFGTRMHT